MNCWGNMFLLVSLKPIYQRIMIKSQHQINKYPISFLRIIFFIKKKKNECFNFYFFILFIYCFKKMTCRLGLSSKIFIEQDFSIDCISLAIYDIYTEEDYLLEVVNLFLDTIKIVEENWCTNFIVLTSARIVCNIVLCKCEVESTKSRVLQKSTLI